MHVYTCVSASYLHTHHIHSSTLYCRTVVLASLLTLLPSVWIGCPRCPVSPPTTEGGTAMEGTTGTKEEEETTPASAMLETTAALHVTIATIEETIVIIASMTATAARPTTARIGTRRRDMTDTIALIMTGAGTTVDTARMGLRPALTPSWDHRLPSPHHQDTPLRRTDSCLLPM